MADGKTRVVKLKKQNGKVVQDCDVYIGRAWNCGGWKLPQSKWHNPFQVNKFGRDVALEKYEAYVRLNATLMSSLHELEGKTLGCWCAPCACHGDVLMMLLEEQKEKSSDPSPIKAEATSAEKEQKDKNSDSCTIKLQANEDKEQKGKPRSPQPEEDEPKTKRKRTGDQPKKSSKKQKKETL